MKNKKKSLEKESHNLRFLLRESILTSNPLKITNLNTNDFKFKTNPNQSNSLSTFSTPNNSRKKLSSFSLVKYKPQRLVHFKGINIPLPSLGKASLDYSKTFNSEKTISSTNKDKTLVFFDSKKTNKTNNNTKYKVGQSDLDTIFKNENIIEFKNKYILKFAEYSDSFTKLFPLNEIMDDTRKIEFKELYSKIAKSLELQSQILLNDVITVPTLDGVTEIKLPSGIQDGFKIRLKERGMINKYGEKGHLFFKVKILFPKELDRKSVV